MRIEYFDFWDYRKIKKYSWKECGFQYDLKYVNWAINNPEYFDINNPPPVLEFPQAPKEMGIFPYLEEEILEMERVLNYSFSKAFTELLFLFGELYFDPYQGGKIRRTYNSSNGYEKRLLRDDIKELKKLQDDFKKDYRRINNKYPPENLFATNYMSDGIYLFRLISNENDSCAVYEYAPEYHGKKEVLVGDSLSQVCLNGINWGQHLLRDQIEDLFFSSYTSKQSMKLIEGRLKSKYKSEKLLIRTFRTYMKIINSQNNREVFIFINYEDQPDYQYELMLQQTKTIECNFLNLNFKEVVTDLANICSLIIKLINK